jgi:hypothetical protein
MRCRLCDSNRLLSVLDLGATPPCEKLLTIDELDLPEPTIPRRTRPGSGELGNYVTTEGCGNDVGPCGMAGVHRATVLSAVDPWKPASRSRSADCCMESGLASCRHSERMPLHHNNFCPRSRMP